MISSSACSSRTPAAFADRTRSSSNRGSPITIRCSTTSSASIRRRLVVWTDDELERLIDASSPRPGLAHEVGFQFVDVKACHGYLLHEFLSVAASRAVRRRSRRRTRVLLSIIERIRDESPAFAVVVRLSTVDMPPFEQGAAVGQPMAYQSLGSYKYGFGLSPDDPLQIDLTEAFNYYAC